MPSSLFRPKHRVDRVQYHLKSIFESDRRSQFAAYEATARFCRESLQQAGLSDIELEELPADGKTSFGDWIMPLAWDVSGATLHLLGDSGTELLADYDVLADSLIQQSAPTPCNGISSELVRFENSDPRLWY